MTAQPAPDSPNRHRDLITRFREEYAAALQDATTSQEHTATEGWQKLHAGQRKGERDERRELARMLKLSSEIMEATGLTEEGEKELGEVRKASAALRDRMQAFETQTIEPVREPVRRCEKLIAEARQQAQMEEDRAPLVNVGLEELARQAIGEVKRVKWDQDTGRVMILVRE